jgi:ATP-dependent DNA helicase RecG
MRASALYPWFTAVTALKFIGPASTAFLAKLLRPTRAVEEVATRDPILRDLLFHLPNGLVDRRRITLISALEAGSYATVEVTIAEHVAPPNIRRRIPYRVVAHDDTGMMLLTFFHVKNDYLVRQLPVGAKRIICGAVEWYDGTPTMAHPEVMVAPEKAAEVLRLAPLYPLTAGLSQRMVQRAMDQAMKTIAPLPEWMDAAFLQEQQFPSFTQALQRLHHPADESDITPAAPARMRLAYDELLANQLALALARRMEQRQASHPIPFDAALENTWRSSLPFTLTQGQQQILEDIRADMGSGKRMVRLLQGDVGSGKTIVAFASMAQAVGAGLQACLMAPTDLLARQHMETLTPLADRLGVRMALLSGKMKKAAQEKLRAEIAAGAVPMVVGTHALFQDNVSFQNLGLMVVDEQHRFGVGQRMKLAGKGQAPHLLQMTATPIPRSLCMTFYGDMEISALTERPPGRKEIDTRAIPAARMDAVVDGLSRVLAAGEKAYWVCPLIEAQDDTAPSAVTLDLAAAEERFAELSERFPGKVGLMHGRMKLPEREKVMQAYAHGDLQLLVATTVVEVGVNVPDATVMVVEHAERFGLAQLHQLRGRVGRSDKPSRCVLLYHDALSETAKARLNILRQTNDGFLIAEEDLRLRGAGDMLGTRQTGLPDFILADMAHHLNLIRIAHDDARLILNRDPDLLTKRGEALRLLLGLFEYDAAMAQLKSV